MRFIRATSVLVSIVTLSAAGAVPALALGGGGTAPGGPLSGGIRPACNGYDMDGTVSRVACDGRSVDERATPPRRDRSR